MKQKLTIKPANGTSLASVDQYLPIKQENSNKNRKG